MDRDLSRRHLWFLFFLAISIVLFSVPLRDLIHFSLTRDYGSHILFVVPVSAYLVYIERREIFLQVHSNLVAGSSLLIAGICLSWIAHLRSRAGDYLWLQILALICLWISGFISCYGLHALRAAALPLLFLLLLVPIPDFVIDRAIFFLQAGSATVAYWLFRMLNVPVLREGFVIRIPTLELEVAKECSGIRSSMVLFITTLLVGQFVLRSFWRKSLLLLSIIPIVILKNALRIVTISLLSVYVNRRFLHGWLHQSGGIVFYLLGLFALLPILMLLRKDEVRGADMAVAGGTVSPEAVKEV